MFSHTNHRIRELLREWTEYEVWEAAGTPAVCMSACSNSATTGVSFRVVASPEGIADVVGRERCVEEEDGRQRGRERCQYSHLNTFFDQ